MSRQETMSMLHGEFMDLIACRAIDRGYALPAQNKKWTMEEVLLMR